VLSIKEREFVQAARAGGKPFYIVLRHVLPQTASYIIISATLAVPGFIVAESVLSLIGLIQQPDPSWEICYHWQQCFNFGTATVADLPALDYPHSVSFNLLAMDCAMLSIRVVYASEQISTAKCLA